MDANARNLNDDHRRVGREEQQAATNETSILPVALRNAEITDADALSLAQKAEEILATGEPPAPTPKNVREGTRVRVRR